MTWLRYLIQPARPVPKEYQWNFLHWYLDMAWFGILNGSTLSFIYIYAARIGASTAQIGLISAAPAVANLLFALPAGKWLSQRPVGKSNFWFGIISRLFYLSWVFIPVVLAPDVQIWAFIIIILILSIPGTVVTVGVNAFIADTVPTAWRANVVGIRNAALAITTVAATLSCGQILIRISFPLNYQIVFGLGFVGAMMSCLHLYLIRPSLKTNDVKPRMSIKYWSVKIKDGSVIQTIIHLKNKFKRLDIVRLDILKGSFGRVIVLLFGFHLAQYFGIPIFPPFLVNQLHFNDQVISIGTALFNLLLFIGSTQLARVTGRFGNKKALGLGVILLSLYPLINSMAQHAGVYYIASIIGGLTFSVVGGALYNYLYDCIPAHDRPSHLAWYNLALNAAILLGSLWGPLFVERFGFINAMYLCAFIRFMAGAAILQWG